VPRLPPTLTFTVGFLSDLPAGRKSGALIADKRPDQSFLRLLIIAAESLPPFQHGVFAGDSRPLS
jgi:hypothetical protein